jgi:hypothetical protein
MRRIFERLVPMSYNSRRTGAAIEAHYQFLTWLMPTVEKFPRSHKFTIGDRIENARGRIAPRNRHSRP